MKTNWQTVILALIVALPGGGALQAAAQQADWSRGGQGDRDHRELHIQHSVTTSQINFPQSLFMYHALDGANSNAEVHGLWGTISLTNHGSEFSEVLWELAYWQGECPVDDQSLAGANIFWTEIQKNPITTCFQEGAANLAPISTPRDFPTPHPSQPSIAGCRTTHCIC
jgi:hypothetical protein